MAILSQEMINALRVHRYSSEGYAILDFCMPKVKLIAEYLPTTLSPNAVTLLGLLSAFIPCVVAIYQTCIGNTEGIQYTAYFCSLGFFIWLICDNLDGTLARLRKASSPFGEVLDHAGDAIILLLSSATFSSFFRIDSSPLMAFAWILTDVATNHIQEPFTIYVCRKFYKVSFDFNEIVLLFVLVSWLTARYGTNIWLYVIIPSIGFQFRYIFYIAKIMIAASLVIGKADAFYNATIAQKKPLSYAVQPVLPLLLVLISASIAYTNASQEFLQNNIIQLSLCFGFSIIKLHIELLIAPITKSKVNLHNYALIFPVSLAFGITYSQTSQTEMLLTYLFLIIVVMDTMVYFLRLLYEIYHAVNTRLFVLDVNENLTKAQKDAN